MRARKRFGQHFLEPVWVTRVVDAVAPQPEDEVVEIGPGKGAMTLPLAARVSRLLAIEIDRDLAAALTARQLPNVTVLCRDVLTVDLADALRTWRGETAPAVPVRVVGNLPYNISSPILFRLLDAGHHGLLTDATLMLQAEVADRLVAPPGTSDYGVLGLVTALDAEVTRLLDVPPGAFRPVPAVRSAVVRLRFRPSPVTVERRDDLIRLIRGIFQQRRKTLPNALRAVVEPDGLSARAVVEAARLDPTCRPESLQLVDLARLAAVWRALAPAPPVL